MPHSKPAKLYADLGTTEKPLKKQCLVAKCAIVAPRFERAKKNLKIFLGNRLFPAHPGTTPPHHSRFAAEFLESKSGW